MQSVALPGVFSDIIGLVPVAFHLAGVQRLPQCTLPSLHMTLFQANIFTQASLFFFTGLQRNQYSK